MRQVNVYHFSNRQLGDVWTDISANSGKVAAAAGSLVAAGIAVQVVPVIGQIAGAVAVITGIIAAARAKSNAIRNNIADIETQQKELRLQSVDLDKAIDATNVQRDGIYQQLKSIGLNGFGDWLKKTFTPGKYYGEIQQDAMDEYDRLVAEVNSKVGVLEQVKNDLENLADTLTGAKAKRVIIYTAGGLGVAGVCYIIARKLGWIKF